VSFSLGVAKPEHLSETFMRLGALVSFVDPSNVADTSHHYDDQEQSNSHLLKDFTIALGRGSPPSSDLAEISFRNIRRVYFELLNGILGGMDDELILQFLIP
jgi:hypothetical protein